MEVIIGLWSFITHLDKHLTELIINYGSFTYVVLFLIIFCETGLVITPFLPGDSLLFVIGALSVNGDLHLVGITLLLIVAAIVGDTVNYHIGKVFGHKLFKNENSKIFNKKHLDKTHIFYERHGGRTIIIARFIPVIRTFAPFVAGMGSMTYWRFMYYNTIGATAWVVIFVVMGYFFGNIPFVEENFTFVIFALILISLLPGIVVFLKNKLKREIV